MLLSTYNSAHPMNVLKFIKAFLVKAISDLFKEIDAILRGITIAVFNANCKD